MQSKKKKKEGLPLRDVKPDNKWFAYYREKFGSSTVDKPARASQGESTSSATSRERGKEKVVIRSSSSRGQERICSMKGSDSIVLPLAYKRIPYEEEKSKNTPVRILGGGLSGNRERRPEAQRSGSSRNVEREESRRQSSVSKEIDSLLALPKVFRDSGKEHTDFLASRSSNVTTSAVHLSTSSRRRSDSSVFPPERSKGADDKLSRARRRSTALETPAPSSSPVTSTFGKPAHRSERLYEPAISSNQSRKPSFKKPGVTNEVSLSDSSCSESEFGQVSNDRPDVHRRAGETINDANSCSSSGSVSSVSLNSRLTEMKLKSDQVRRPSTADDKLTVNSERRTSQSTNYERGSLMSSSSRDSRAPRDSAAGRSHMEVGIGGLVGLMNEGNTCYLNSCLQCLAHLLPLASSVQGSLPDVGQRRASGRAGSSERDFSSLTELLAYSFRQLVRDLWQRAAFSATSARTFLQCVQAWAPQFSGHSQHDAQEVLRAILDGLHEALNKVTTTPPYRDLYIDPKPEEELAELTWRYHKQCQDSIIQDIFCGQLQSTIECCTCRRKSHCFDPFLDLSLPFPKNAGESSIRDQFRGGHSKARVTLQDCVSAFVAPEQLEGSNKYYCPSCKRFFKSDRYSYQKDDTPVYYPLRGLDLTGFLPSRRIGKEAVIYDLYGVCCHMGSLSGGHYTALCKNWENDMWRSSEKATFVTTER